MRRVFDLVRDYVIDANGGRHHPFIHGGVLGRQDFYFKTGADAARRAEVGPSTRRFSAAATIEASLDTAKSDLR